MFAAVRPATLMRDAAAILRSVLPPQFRGAVHYEPLPVSTASKPAVVLSGNRTHSPGQLLRTRRAKLLAAAVFFFIVFVVAVPILGLGGGVKAATRRARWRVGRETYISAVLQNPVEGLLDPEPIRQKCNVTVFQPGLVWQCAPVSGGIGTAGNMWLNCVRYALEAGATSLILPRIGARSPGSESTDLAELYDVDFFLSSWNTTCPSMRAVRSDAELALPNLPSLAGSPELSPAAVGSFARKQELIIDPRSWRRDFDNWLSTSVTGAGAMSPEQPVRIVQRAVLGQWNREAHDPDFASAFPRLFRHPATIRRLAAVALWSLESSVVHQPVVADAVLFPHVLAQYVNMANSSLTTSLGAHRVEPASFQGAYLRVADDGQAGWPGYDVQAPAYLDEAVRDNHTVIFLAAGSEKHARRFRGDAQRRGLTAVTKEDLLEGRPELEQLLSLSAEQQAIVDFEVLLHSGHFAGFVRSSFSWQVAIRRSVLPEAGIPTMSARRRAVIPTRRGSDTADKVGKVEKYRDGLSLIVGLSDSVVIQGVWS